MKIFKILILLWLTLSISYGGEVFDVSGEMELHLDNDNSLDKITYKCLEGYPSDCNLTLIYANGTKRKKFHIKQNNYNSLEISSKKEKGVRELELSFQAGKSDGKRQYFEYNEKEDDWFITYDSTYVYINQMWDEDVDVTAYDEVQWNLSGNRLLINKKDVHNLDKSFNIFLVNTGDIDGDKKEDIVFVSKNRLYIYLQKANKLTPFSHHNLNFKKDSTDSCKYYLNGLKIKKSVLDINYFAICDSLQKRAFLHYKFKYRKKRMRLIGAEYFVPPMNSCDGECYSINYLSTKIERYDCSGCDIGGVRQIGKREKASFDFKKRLFLKGFSIDEWKKVLDLKVASSNTAYVKSLLEKHTKIAKKTMTESPEKISVKADTKSYGEDTIAIIVTHTLQSNSNPYTYDKLWLYEVKEHKIKALLSDFKLNFSRGDKYSCDYREGSHKYKVTTASSSKIVFEHDYDYRHEEFCKENKTENWHVKLKPMVLNLKDGVYVSSLKKEKRVFDLLEVYTNVKKGLNYRKVVLEAMLFEEPINKKNREIYAKIGNQLSLHKHKKEAKFLLNTILKSSNSKQQRR